ncbi:MAG TPA: tRNA glutamyl-Q(34) synthetase GluQRS [Geminicoccaceae bacterium]|nr:tRNA glutamyl-Q(34) synthetase GluQRS [Geminicoccaceae bacterium]
MIARASILNCLGPRHADLVLPLPSLMLHGVDFIPIDFAMAAASVTRFAPSPTGYLHLGHAYSALFAFEAARAAGGRFRLRIEDIDGQRCRAEFEEAIYEDLAWLGLSWDEPVRRQSDHLDTHRQALDELRHLGVAYPCFCSRKQIRAEIEEAGRAPHGPSGEPVYPGICRDLDRAEAESRMRRGEPYGWRLDVGRALGKVGEICWEDCRAGLVRAEPQLLGDVVIARKDVPTSYHLAVTVDDHLQGVTLVTRGEDLFTATHVHRLLQALLGLRTPRYYHHNLIADSSGQRMSKRNRAVTLRHLRETRRSPDDIWRMVGLAIQAPAPAG